MNFDIFPVCIFFLTRTLFVLFRSWLTLVSIRCFYFTFLIYLLLGLLRQLHLHARGSKFKPTCSHWNLWFCKLSRIASYIHRISSNLKHFNILVLVLLKNNKCLKTSSQNLLKEFEVYLRIYDQICISIINLFCGVT